MTGTIYDELRRTWAHHQLPSAPADPPEETMDLAVIEQDIRERVQDVITDAEHVAARAREVVQDHLPQLARAADAIQGSQIIQALEGAVLSPADETFIASLVKRLDTAAAAEQAAEPPADTSTEPTADTAPEAPSAPVVGGQAR